jgi:epoxyqueuosine reductase
VVRGATVWALSRLLDPAEFEGLRDLKAPLESDEAVRAEWVCAPA